MGICTTGTFFNNSIQQTWASHPWSQRVKLNPYLSLHSAVINLFSTQGCQRGKTIFNGGLSGGLGFFDEQADQTRRARVMTCEE
jgi:hypothetical protein